MLSVVLETIVYKNNLTSKGSNIPPIVSLQAGRSKNIKSTLNECVTSFEFLFRKECSMDDTSLDWPNRSLCMKTFQHFVLLPLFKFTYIFVSIGINFRMYINVTLLVYIYLSDNETTITIFYHTVKFVTNSIEMSVIKMLTIISDKYNFIFTVSFSNFMI
jgi:hypothetical protein